MSLKKTPLYPLYSQLGARTIEFGGWDMPVQFVGILDEHEAVRNKAGLFDVSHMGEFEVVGPDARAAIQYWVTNDISNLSTGHAIYTPMVYPDGGTVDDLLVYCLEENKFWLVVNAGNREKDFSWIEQNKQSFQVEIRDISDQIALLALQGPASHDILAHFNSELIHLKPFEFVETNLGGFPCLVSATGYTGELGFEIYVQENYATSLFSEILKIGQPYGLIPAGLGARDTLRLEARLPLYGHELSQDITPIEAGLKAFVKFDKGDFIGKEALYKQWESGLSRKIVGLRMIGRGIPRQGYSVYAKDSQEVIGFLTSGTQSPTLKTPIGLAMLDMAYTAIGTQVEVEIRGRKVLAEVIKTPFYRRPSTQTSVK
ncbi:glycine cleavage system aminomethyltransferase GcvT [Alicyclobacillus tolerans]|uniref:glycine cleavage system aminomethyltransferase GcvT n=1 Tax=Alicyclobacillus tolerans TaxID=90970 RepID=UPI003B81DE16